MDTISFVFFGLFLPIAAIYAAYVIIRFRKNYTSHLKSYKAAEISDGYDIVDPDDTRDSVDGK